MGSVCNLGTECRDVLLLNWDWLVQDVKTSAHKVNVAHFMVPDDAVHSLIVVGADGRCEVDLDSDEGLGLDDSFCHCETEHIEAVAEELEVYGQVRVIVDRKQPVGRIILLDFTELDRARRQSNVVASCLTLAVEVNRISSLSGNPVVCARTSVCNRWCVLDLD